MTAFEDFMNLEVPRRPALLTVAITGFDGDPNVGAPPIIISSPVGTFYLQETPDTFWRKTSLLTWKVVGQAGGIIGETIISMGQPESYGSDVPNMVAFTELDPTDFLSVAGMVFSAVFANGNETVATRVQFYNVTGGVVVTELTLTGAGATVQQNKVSSTLLVPGDIPAASRIYAVRILVDAPSLVSDTIEFGTAQLRVLP